MSANLVVVGYGLGFNQRLQHCEVIQQTNGLNLYGICDLDEARREEAHQQYGVVTFSTIEEILSDDKVDAVVAATPNQSHAPIALQCLEAKKHVILEKPMCLTTGEADALIDSSRRNQVLLTVRHNRRWDGDYLTVKSIMDQGILGRIFVLDSAFNALIKPSNWRAQKEMGGGEFIDWGCHLIDQALQLMTSNPVSAFAHVNSYGWEVEVETYARVLLRFDDGAISEIETSNISWLPRPRWYVLGEKGSLVYWDGKFRLRTQLEDKDILPVKGNDAEFYSNFSEALHKRKELHIKPEEARNVIAVLEAALLSAQTGQIVQLQEKLLSL